MKFDKQKCIFEYLLVIILTHKLYSLTYHNNIKNISAKFRYSRSNVKSLNHSLFDVRLLGKCRKENDQQDCFQQSRKKEVLPEKKKEVEEGNNNTMMDH
jgi:hypothetical protein